MAGKGGNRQQKQAAKAVRRRQVVAAKQQTERLASSLPGRVAAAAAAPIHCCLRSDDIETAGIGQVILARMLPSGALGCAIFLVDILCLGVKDVFYREMAPSGLDEHIEILATSGQQAIPIDPASAKKLIMGAVAFAAGSGIEPAKSFKTVLKLFDGIDAALATETFTFGRKGKAFYVPGPNDSASTVRNIENKLIKARGPDGWSSDMTAGMPGPDRLALFGVLDALSQIGDAEDGLVIEHEPSTEPPNP